MAKKPPKTASKPAAAKKPAKKKPVKKQPVTKKAPSKKTRSKEDASRKAAPKTAVAVRVASPPDHWTPDWVDRRVYVLRSQKVMLDADLAEIYGVETRVLVQAVKRNLDRFPEDFMFQLTEEEVANLTSQSVISSFTHGGRRHLPYAFTELGIAMLSSVLHSAYAVQANIWVMRAFVRLREYLATHRELAARVGQLEGTQRDHSSYISFLADEIDQLKLPPPDPPKRRIGYPTKVASAKAG
jgi:hypothetical protein